MKDGDARPFSRGTLLVALLLGTALLDGAAGAAEPTAPSPADVAAYDLDVDLGPGTGLLRVTARIAVPAGAKADFLLNAALKVTKAEPGVEEVPLGDVAAFFGNNASAEEPSRRVPPKP